jgi:hypothetical protein
MEISKVEFLFKQEVNKWMLPPVIMFLGDYFVVNYSSNKLKVWIDAGMRDRLVSFDSYIVLNSKIAFLLEIEGRMEIWLFSVDNEIKE